MPSEQAKNLLIAGAECNTFDSESSDTSPSSASDSETVQVQELKSEWRNGQSQRREAVKGMSTFLPENSLLTSLAELKHEFEKARSVIHRVRSSRKSPPPNPHYSPDPASPTPSPNLIYPRRTSEVGADRPKIKMSFALVSLLVYTVGVKCRGINKKEEYAPEHIFSLSENTANKILKGSMIDLIKHTRTHVVRIYPKGMRLSSTNYEPHRYWSAGAQLVAINWQTFGMSHIPRHGVDANAFLAIRFRVYDQPRYVPAQWTFRIRPEAVSTSNTAQGHALQTHQTFSRHHSHFCSAAPSPKRLVWKGDYR